MVMIYQAVRKLVQYGLNTGLIMEEDAIYVTNQILDVLGLDEYEEPEHKEEPLDLEAVLKELLDYACEAGILEDSVTYRDLFDTRLMNCLMPRPSQVIHEFWKHYETSPAEATEYFYKLS